MKRTSSAILALALTLAAGAQNLDSEITVDREIAVNPADARPLPLTPKPTLPALRPVRLDFSSDAVATRVPDDAAFLEPVAWTDPAAAAGVRGYAALALFPVWNSTLSAGYRVVDTEHTRLNAWLQYDASVYRRGWSGSSEMVKPWWREHSVTADIALRQDVGSKGLLTVNADYTLGRFNYRLPDGTATRGAWQTTNNVGVDLGWAAKAGGLGYEAYAAFRHFGYNSALPLLEGPSARAARECRYRFGGKAAFGVDDDIDAGLRLALDVLDPRDDSATGLLSLTPFLRFRRGTWSLDAGPRIEFTFNGGKAFHIAPEIVAGWLPSPFFALDLRAGGGERFNSLACLSYEALRADPSRHYGMSHIPLTLDAGITLGPLRGCSLRLFGGWAKANSWLMPVALPEAPGFLPPYFMPVNLSAFHGGAELRAAWRETLTATARYEAAPGSFGRAYYLNRDRARHVVDIRLEARPFDRLTVDAAWQLRASRAAYTYGLTEVAGSMVATHTRVNLHNVSQLSLGAMYAVTPRLSVFLRGLNLLNHNHNAIDGTPSRGITALVGASYKLP